MPSTKRCRVDRDCKIEQNIVLKGSDEAADVTPGPPNTSDNTTNIYVHRRKSNFSEDLNGKIEGGSADQAQVMASAVSPAWFAQHTRPPDHARASSDLRARMPAANARGLRRNKSIFEPPVPIIPPVGDGKWPMDDYEPPPFPPPWPSKSMRDKMRDESSNIHPELPLGPLASRWVGQLFEWYAKLQKQFLFDPKDLAANVRRSEARWARRLEFMREDQPELHAYVMDMIRRGHVIPLKEIPKKLFRKSNPPSLAADKDRAWAAVKGDIEHGAVQPVNIPEEGVPECVCPVRTADKNDGTARFVHNTRHVNKCVDPEKTKCRLETLLRTRNMYMPGGYLVGSDYASGYHCIYANEDHQKYLAFALHVSELPDEAIRWLKDRYPHAYYHKKRCFIFKYRVLPFGLSSSCNAFSAVICALMASWRRYKTYGSPTRVSSYVDDVSGVQERFEAALWLSIRMVYEAAALGLSLKIKKCSFFPRRAMIILGTIVDLNSYTFRVASRRANKIAAAIQELTAAVMANPKKVPAKLIASFVGLIWSIASCCQRAASVMTRDIVALLSKSIRQRLSSSAMSLKAILAAFWSGTVEWSASAQVQLRFWSCVRFLLLHAPISADVLGKAIELTFDYPALVNSKHVSVLYQDASATASGGGILDKKGLWWTHRDELFLSQFSEAESELSSTLREILGISRCLMATEKISKYKIIFACDNLQSVQAIKYGSSTPEIQQVACDIFTWCLRNGKLCWPVWLPRTHHIIKEADRRSRLMIPHDQRSPIKVVQAANGLVVRLWKSGLSFDQMASHLTNVSVEGERLPYNSFCFQAGAAGVDTFTQWVSWRSNINYVYPPAPMTGRLLTFLPSTESRAIVVVPLPIPCAWWTYALSQSAKGVVAQSRVDGFLITAFDFRASQPPPEC